MELRQVRYVVAIARHGSFTAAAAELRIAQPALSRQIQQIEREIGVLLFDRSRRQISPTPAGLAFVARADTLLSDVLALREEMQEFAGLLRGRVVIGALQSLAELRLPGMLAAFHQRYPGITVALREGNSGPLIDSLLAGQLDLALVHRIGTMQQAPAAWQGIEIEPLYTEGLVPTAWRTVSRCRWPMHETSRSWLPSEAPHSGRRWSMHAPGQGSARG